jgi:hypothetical protein
MAISTSVASELAPNLFLIEVHFTGLCREGTAFCEKIYPKRLQNVEELINSIKWRFATVRTVYFLCDESFLELVARPQILLTPCYISRLMCRTREICLLQQLEQASCK